MAAPIPYDDLRKAFESRAFEPLYLVYGEERWFIDSLQQTLIRHAIPEHERDFNQDILYGADVDARAALSACQSYPMMAERRLVVIRDFDRMKDNSLFKALGEQPNPACIVFLVCSGKPNLSHHPYRALKGAGRVANFRALYPNETARWIGVVARAKGYKLNQQAIHMLAEFVGTSLSAAAAELDKISTYAGERSEITADDVIRSSGQTREFNVFELQRVVGLRDYAAALRISERLLQQSSNPAGECTKIVAILSSFFLKLWQLTGLQRTRIAENDMAKRVGLSPYILKGYLQALRKYNLRQIEGAISALTAADFELKGGSARSERMILHLLLRQVTANT
ncbi:MAG: DNA polymerase III subunit delta [Bacteroidetes bacterium CG12_big_fil_rev_8_21_14_0_65_60_17]|nr:MAG: DNA polymerase III subunit delta [Bacteroidetes bacterium CG12_big_fil_rev_8_21_14_0_65_60_17]